MKPAHERFTLQGGAAGAEAPTSRMAEDVRRGLESRPRTLPAKYFYDDFGSQLFEQITELPEYYQTRTEFAVLQQIATELAAEGPYTELVELGSGAAKKTRALLDAMQEAGSLRRYVAIDVSELMLRESAAALLARYVHLRIHAVTGDFLRDLGALPPREGARLVIFLGSTIGNLDVDERAGFLKAVHDLLGPGDAFLLGVDLVKDVARLEAAYNDAAGVTAEFNLNILRVINRELHADFDPADFRHVAFYNAREARIEMHLIAASPLTGRIGALDMDVTLGAGETIRTEISCKFTRQSLEAVLGDVDLFLDRWYTDPEGLFGLALVRRPG